ncbi:hypothetical protein L1987_19489 [Smallanthus sonchifolius]|uniref:Uncharacterized protein n=1 Tax=Smallanthus sonchifolius TaxID=185202 RepID=A0ACB9IPZ4_9ASTR|nr:hypothetical protein L1987_19489 [Smallanthus sonchifolius]
MDAPSSRLLGVSQNTIVHAIRSSTILLTEENSFVVNINWLPELLSLAASILTASINDIGGGEGIDDLASRLDKCDVSISTQFSSKIGKG